MTDLTITHIAMIGTSAAVVTGDTCDLSITQAVIGTYRLVPDGNGGEIEEPQYETNGVVEHHEQLTTKLADGTRDTDATNEADDLLPQLGYRRIGDWGIAGDAIYAQLVTD